MRRLRAIGVDGCRAGWVLAAADVDAKGRPGTITISVVSRFDAVLAARPARVAVDMPIGLPDTRTEGGRACDVAARRLLGFGRGASVFPAPPRTALELDGFGDPRRPAMGLSQQTFAILPRIAEVDAALTPAHQDPAAAGPLVMEVHPEVVFSDLNGGVSMPESKHAPEGLVRRRMLLEDALGRPLPVMIPRGAAQDDVLDALACLWVAAAPLASLVALPADGVPRDARGLAMQIWRRDPADGPVSPRLPPRRRVPPEQEAIDRLLEALGPLPGVTVHRASGTVDPAADALPTGRLGLGDLQLESARARVVVAVGGAGGVSTLVACWPLLRDGLDDKGFRLVGLLPAATPGEYASVHRSWRFLVDRIEDDLDAIDRPRGTTGGWDAELVVIGPAVADDPLPGVASRIRAALGLPPAD